MVIVGYNDCMNCPIDQTPLTIADRQGIEIDFCPTCRGVWLDRGELDKLIERSTTFAAPMERREQSDDRRHFDQPSQNHHHDYDDDDHGRHGKHHKKESFLGDIFDF